MDTPDPSRDNTSWWRARFRPVAANAFIIGFFLVVYRIQPFPNFSISDDVWTILAVLGLIYILGFALYALFRQPARTKGEILFSLLGKVLSRRMSSVTSEERLAFLILLVKVYYLPIMTGFLLNNTSEVKGGLLALLSVPDWTSLFSLSVFNTNWFPLLLASLLLIDVAYFTFGYIVDHPSFGNVIRSVDPTFLGWAATLACYPPFNMGVGLVIGTYTNDNAFAYATPWDKAAFNIAALLLFSIYVWATLALGTKCSNLTNRGIVRRGPYAYVRHPAYITKNAVWVLSVLPLGLPVAYASAALWAGIYYLRAITEERHLSRDPDYIAYKAQVPWRFIPGIW